MSSLYSKQTKMAWAEAGIDPRARGEVQGADFIDPGHRRIPRLLSNLVMKQRGMPNLKYRSTAGSSFCASICCRQRRVPLLKHESMPLSVMHASIR
jgi:hypothetical protein